MRTEARRPTSGLIEGEIPERVRNAVERFLLYKLDDQDRSSLWDALQGGLFLAVGRAAGDYVSESDIDEFRNSWSLRWFLEGCDLLDYLDALTIIFDFLQDRFLDLRDEFRDTLNQSLLRFYSAYQMMPDGVIVLSGSAPAELAIAEARALLTDTRFAGPDRQFQSAIHSLQRRPNPNFESAIAEALGALEGVVRIALGDERVKLGEALIRIREEHHLHKALVQSISNMYGYASDAGGRHGLVGEPDADSTVAEFCVHQSAAAIILIARLYGVSVQR